MKATVLFASPRGRESNTMALLRPALLAGKAMAAVVTCGYRPERGADLFLEGCAAGAATRRCAGWVRCRSGTWATVRDS